MKFILLKCTIQWLLVHSQYCTTIATNSRTISSLQNGDQNPLTLSTLSSSFPIGPDNHCCTFCFCLPTANISFKCNHIPCGLLCLDSLTQMTMRSRFFQNNVFKMHLHCSIYQDFIPFYNRITFYCMNMSYIFIHSSVNGHVGLFPLWSYQK